MDSFIVRAIDLLARDEDPKSHQMVPIDFKSLGVRQLGSIYEGLLEFKLRIAAEKKAIVKEKSRDIYVPFVGLTAEQRERAEWQRRVVAKGHVYLENDKGERKATGSYYTPDHIVNYIVEQAVGPVLREKFDAMRPKLREAEQWHRQQVKAAKVKGEKPEKYETGPVVENQWRGLVGELFDVKILDPAMGSGHFLVEAVDYITDKALDFLNAFPWNPVTAHLEMVRTTILDQMDEQGVVIDRKRLTDVNLLKRHVLKRCIYGVDLNPMAVELAKVSLWLHCFTLGAPLSFLDHHMRCGNSLIGVSVEEVQDELRQGTLFGSAFTGLMLATNLMRHVGELSDVTTTQVHESRTEFHQASEALAPFKRILDVYTSRWFGNEARKGSSGRSAAIEPPVIAFLKSRAADALLKARTPDAIQNALAAMSPADKRIAQTALAEARQRRFFHWELEFPEVFYGPRPGTERTIGRLDGAGFDAVVGNPPYVRQEAYVILSRRGIDIDRYPAIKRHLQQFRRRLEPKPDSWNADKGKFPSRAPGDYKWYELQASPSDEFVAAVQQPKIVYQEIQFHSWFALDKSGAVPSNKVFFLPTNDPRLLAILNSPLMWWVLTRTLPHMKDAALNPAGFIMEQLCVRLPDGAIRKDIADYVTALCSVTEDRYAEEHRFLENLAALNRGNADRRALNWLRRANDEFTGIVERSSAAPISTTTKRELVALKNGCGVEIARLVTEQLRLEEELAVLVEDIYELDSEERNLLRATRAVRDPLDVLKASLSDAGEAPHRDTQQEAETRD